MRNLLELVVATGQVALHKAQKDFYLFVGGEVILLPRIASSTCLNCSYSPSGKRRTVRRSYWLAR